VNFLEMLEREICNIKVCFHGADSAADGDKLQSVGVCLCVCLFRMSLCGEDLLVDLSEVLFNELAFFRLMQNLDTSNAKVKEKLRTFAKVISFIFLIVNETERKQNCATPSVYGVCNC